MRATAASSRAMAAVAGSVAEELIAAFDRPAHRARLRSTTAATSRCISRRARRVEVGLFADPRARPSPALPLDGHFDDRRGVAGARRRHPRLARPQLLARHRRQRDRARGAPRRAADAAATVIANAVDVDDAAHRPRAGERDAATTAISATASSPRDVPPLPPALVEAALDARRRRGARRRSRAGRIIAAVLSLQGRWRVVGDVRPLWLGGVGARAAARRARRRRTLTIVERFACLSRHRRAARRSTSASSSARSRTSGTTTARAWPRRCGAAASPRC